MTTKKTTKNKQRDAKEYVNENSLHTVKIIESLEGASFEPVSIQQIIDRVGEVKQGGKTEKLKTDKVRRVLLTLQLLGWAIENDKKQWSPGAKVLRFANRYSEICIVNSTK